MKSQHFLPILRTNLSGLIIIVFMGCSNHKQIDIQGHRGCRGLYPENSLPAFAKAIDLGVHTLELDIVINKDNEVVVSHEPFMSRTICYDSRGGDIPDSMDMQYNLYKMTHKEIKQFDCGSKFHKVYPDQIKLGTYKPLLVEVFELAKSKNSNVKFNIEIKSKPEYYGIYTPEPEEYVSLVLDEISRSHMFNQSNLQSFDIIILEEIKRQSPKMKLALLVDEDETINDKLHKLSFKPEIISPYFKLLTLGLINYFHDNGYEIIPWTVNSKQDMTPLLRWGVDGIITDYPNILLELTKE